MTDEELVAIAARNERIRRVTPDIRTVVDTDAMLAEIKRLRAIEHESNQQVITLLDQMKLLMKIAEAVANSYQPTKYSYGRVSSRTIEQARALLGMQEGTP